MKRAKSPAHHILCRPRSERRKAVPVIMPFLHESSSILARQAGIGKPPRIFAREGRIRGTKVAVVDPGLGAPAAVLTLEETMSRGYRDFFFLGACGGLAPNLRIGDVILPVDALSEEGTSRLYTKAGPRFKSNSVLARLLEETSEELGLAVTKGTIWTTDAPYRETPAKIRKYRRLEVIGVEMETSALFAVAKLRRARVAGLLVVSDLLHDEWIMGWRWKACMAGEVSARKIVLEAALRMARNRGELLRRGGTV